MRRSMRPWPISFTAEGLNIARFLRFAGEENLRLTNIRRKGSRKVSACVCEDSLPALEALAMRGGWKLKLGTRHGAGRAAEWLRGRWLLTAAALIVGIALYAASQVVWQIEITGAGAYSADIRAALAEMGITAPMLRSSINLGELRDELEWRYPRLAWFECGWRGAALIISPAEGVLPLVDQREDVCNIVASRDGLVHTIVTKAGTPVVKPGDVVGKGDVLIRGEERAANGEIRPVAAQGSVIARVWTAAAVEMPVFETITNYTGRTESVWTIRTPWFDFWPLKESSFDQYDTSVSEMAFGGIFLPVKLHMEMRMEAEITSTRRDQAELEADANAAALRKLNEKLGVNESLIDIWGNCSMIDDETLLSVATGEILAEIGMRAIESGMAAPEQLPADK